MMDRHARWLLAVLLLGQLVVLTRQASGPGGSDPPRAARWVVRAVGPVADAVVGVGELVGDFDEGFKRRETLRRENEGLRDRVRELERELLRREGLEEQLDRLAEAVRYSGSTRQPLQVADVVYADHRSWLRSLVVRTGEGDTESGQPVVAPEGLVGRVVVAAGRYAKVQLITDRSSAVGAMIERSRRQGVLRGQGESPLTLEYVPLSADVRVGDRVVTAGIDGTYPRGIPLGVVTAAEPGPQLFQRIRVQLRVDLGLLDTVYLLPRQDTIPELEAGGLP